MVNSINKAKTPDNTKFSVELILALIMYLST